MLQALYPAFGLAAYLIAVFGSLIGIISWKKSRTRRLSRPPLEIKLLRGPGESLQRRMRRFEEDFFLQYSALAMIPFLVGSLLFGLLLQFAPRLSLWQDWSVVLAVGVVLTIPIVLWGIKGVARYWRDRAGYLGERRVAECLQPLRMHGCHLFHDLPATGKGKDFNIDHVVVGPFGVAAIETKTYGKRRGRSSNRDWVVQNYGDRLVWSWGETRRELEQAQGQAEWLRNWIYERTGISVAAKPILALPGWFTELKAPGSVAVENEKRLVSAVLTGAGPVLTEAQIRRIAAEIEGVCRDVEE